MPEELMTVAEFCAKHCADEVGDLRASIQQHVDTLVMGALVKGYSLWKTGVDDEGRVSLIWSSMPLEAWEHLLRQSVEIVALQKMIVGML